MFDLENKTGWILRAHSGVSRRVVGLLLGTALVCVGLPAADAGAFQSTEVNATWAVIGVGPHGRSLDLVYTLGGCLGGVARPTVSETHSTVTIQVRQDAQTTGPGEACADFLGERQTVVRLSAPLDGRPILGRPATPLTDVFIGMVSIKGMLRVPMPRLVGFAPADAKRALRLRHLHARIRHEPGHGGRARVIAQDPAPGEPLAQHASVTITSRS